MRVITDSVPGLCSTHDGTNRIEAGPNTRNIPGGAIHQSFPTEEEAIRVFEAAKARGDVKAYPDAGKEDKPTVKSKKAQPSPLSPLGEEASLLRIPLNLKEEAESTGLLTPVSSPARARVAELRRTLADSTRTEAWTTFSSPPTETTRVNPPLYIEDIARPSPHFTFTSSSSRAYPDVSDTHFLEMDMPPQLDVSDWDSSSPSSSSSDSQPGAERHTSKTMRWMPLDSDPPSRNRGVEYRGLTDLADMQRVDPRIWLPESRIFDPAKVKPRPLTRSPSPVKRDASPGFRHDTVGNTPQLGRRTPLVGSPFVRTGRGRHLQITPSLSLPILLDRELEGKCSVDGSRLTQLLQNHCTGKGKEKKPDHTVRDKGLAEQYAGYSPNHSRFHVQLVPRDSRDEQSTIVVHCPPNCPHEACVRSPLAELSQPTGTRHVDACVSPVASISGRTLGEDNPAKIRSKRPDLDADHLYEFAGFTHVSHQGIGPEADVRSPISKGTKVPAIAAEMGRTWRIGPL